MSAISPTTRRWMSPPIYESAHSAREGTALKPYLTLPYILSLTWLAYPIISVLFVAFRLQISSASAQNAVSDGKSNLLTSCSAAEKAATVAASLPRYMAIGTNKQIAEAVNGTMSAARATLVLALSILEAVINFAIDIYRSTFFCFLELVVRGGLSVLIGAVDEINSFLTSTFSSIRTTIQGDITSINSAIQSAVNAINDVNPFSKISAPQFSVPDLSSLSNVTLPSSVEDALTTLNSSLPTIDQIKNSIADVVDTPFEALKADINNTFAGLNFNESTLYVPEQQTLSFCGDMDTSVVDDLGHDLLKITKIGVIILVLLAVLLLGAHCALEWYKWRCLQQHLEYTRQAWTTDPTMDNAVKSNGAPSIRMTNHNLLLLAGTLQHPLLTRISNQLAALLRLSPSQHMNLQWFFHYVFHPPALACFLIGFLGLLSVELQLIAIHPLEAKYSSQVATSVSDFSNTIATSINASMYNQSATYANQINSMVDSTQSTINDGLFGWVNGTTTMLNDTLVTFYSDVQNAVSTIFNGTVLEDPIQEFVRCIIGTKIEAIEEALTFLHNNLAIDIPRLNDSVLVLSQANVNEATQPIAEAAVGNGTDGSQGLVGKIVASYVASLEKERIMFIVFIGLWGLVVLIALLIILYHSYAKPAIDARRQRKSDHPFTSDAASTYPAGKATNDLPSFTRRLTPMAERSFNVSSPTGRQSLRNLDAVDQRSWDGLLDFSTQNDNGPKQSLESPAEKALKKKKSPPRKLVAIGKKAGKERFISDEERIQVAEANSAEDEAKEVSWMKKLTNAFHKKGSDDGFGFSSVPRGSSNSRPRPKLTIATNTTNMGIAHVARDQLPADGGAPARSPRIQNDPPSAWSASPNPPRALPWLLNPLSTAGKQTKSKPNMLGLPLSPHRNVSTSVDSAYGPPVLVDDRGSNVNAAGGFAMPAAPVSAATVTPAAQTPFSAVPSYYLTLPLHAGRDSLLPENTLATRGAHPHKRSSSVPLQKLAPSVIEAHHGSRQPAASHVRHGSVAVDPFRTPFDDDARVIPEQPRDAATHTNPFSPVVF